MTGYRKILRDALQPTFFIHLLLLSIFWLFRSGAHSEVVLTLGNDFGVDSDFTTDFYFWGVIVFIKLRAGGKSQKDEPIILKVVLDINESFDIFKNKGEFKWLRKVGVPTIESVVSGKFAHSNNKPSRVGAYHEFGGAVEWNISGSLDLLYFAKYLGPAGAAVSGINKIVEKLEWLSNGKLNIDYGIELYASLATNTNLSVTHHDIDGVGGKVNIKIRIVIGLRVLVEAEAKLKDVKLYAGLELGSEARLKADIYYRDGMDSPKIEGEFEGLFAKAEGKLGKEDIRGEKSEISFSVAETLLEKEIFEIGN